LSIAKQISDSQSLKLTCSLCQASNLASWVEASGLAVSYEHKSNSSAQIAISPCLVINQLSRTAKFVNNIKGLWGKT
jgi:hypothetical protein